MTATPIATQTCAPAATPTWPGERAERRSLHPACDFGWYADCTMDGSGPVPYRVAELAISEVQHVLLAKRGEWDGRGGPSGAWSGRSPETETGPAAGIWPPARVAAVVFGKGHLNHMVVVVGMAFEARIAAPSGLKVICSGDGRNLVASLKHAIALGCSGLVSFGVAGGLAPGLRAGTCIVGSAVVCSEAGHLPTDTTLSQKLLDATPGAVHGVLAGVARPVMTPAAKRALSESTGAMAVDTESHVVARVAAEHDLPMVAIRVISDPAGRSLPELALQAVRADGTTDVRAVMRSLLRRPQQLPLLLQTAIDAYAARTTLLRGRELLGPMLFSQNRGVSLRPEPAIDKTTEALAWPHTAPLPSSVVESEA